MIEDPLLKEKINRRQENMKIINAGSGDLSIKRFEAYTPQAWCIIGANRSGIRKFYDLICGKARDVIADCLDLPENVGRVSFKDQQEIYECELKKDDTDYLNRPDPGTLVRDFLDPVDDSLDLIEKFGMTSCLGKGYRQLSTGQARKLMLLSQIVAGRSVLAIHAPFEGLDAKSQKEVNCALKHLHQQNILLIFFVHNFNDIPAWCTHGALMENGRITVQGRLDQVMDPIENKSRRMSADFRVSARDYGLNKGIVQNETKTDKSKTPSGEKPELVCLKNGSAGYGGKAVFQDISFTMVRGDHTLVTGPNGCGKSTLLHVVTGDHPACYQNDLRIFGVCRGSGESIWELKKKMGIVSPELHRNYYLPGPVLHCVISGLFDSIGLYRHFSRQQEKQAEAWLDRIGLADSALTPFRELTFADQRLVLIARALIKVPDLLILDEPTQGLDQANRNALLDFLEELAADNICTLLYVSHRQDEIRPFFVHHLRMGET
jgi:molybdate transport system ATP-binding protein